MIVSAPRWKGTGLGRVRGRGLGDTMGPTIDPTTGLPTMNPLAAINQAYSDLANLPSDQLSQVLQTFTMGGNPLVSSTSTASSSTALYLAIGAGVLLLVILAGGRR
jgi:hypothetical protein